MASFVRASRANMAISRQLMTVNYECNWRRHLEFPLLNVGRSNILNPISPLLTDSKSSRLYPYLITNPVSPNEVSMRDPMWWIVDELVKKPDGIIELPMPLPEGTLSHLEYKCMNRNGRRPKKANHGARPCSSYARRARRPRRTRVKDRPVAG